MTKSRDSQLLDCILIAAKELKTIEGLEAINTVLNHMESRAGIITDTNNLNNVRNQIQNMISKIS